VAGAGDTDSMVLTGTASFFHKVGPEIRDHTHAARSNLFSSVDDSSSINTKPCVLQIFRSYLSGSGCWRL
jgi:hypothetical protein